MLVCGLLLASLPDAGGPGRALWGAAALAWCAATLRWWRRYHAALRAPCPRCGRAFFASWERVLWSIPILHGSCAHCDLALGAPRAHR